MNPLDHMMGVVTAPVRTLRAVYEERPVGWAIALLVLTSLRAYVSPLLEDVGSYGLAMGVTQARIASWLVYTVAILLLIGVTHVVARAFASEGDLIGYFSAAAFAAFPGLLDFPLMLLAQGRWVSLANLLSLALGVWIVVLHVLAVRESYRVRTGAAVLIGILGVLGTSLTITLLAVLMTVLLGLV